MTYGTANIKASDFAFQINLTIKELFRLEMLLVSAKKEHLLTYSSNAKPISRVCCQFLKLKA